MTEVGCRQVVERRCEAVADHACEECGKPVCLVHQYFSLYLRGGDQVTRHWPVLCVTCYALERHHGRPIAQISASERWVFFQTQDGAAFVGPWDLRSIEKKASDAG
jgi:hypothetical protein